MAQRVTRCALGDAGVPHGVLEGTLEHRLVEVVAAALAGLSVDVETRGGEDPLPSPLAPGVGVLARQSPRQFHPSRRRDAGPCRVAA